MSKLGAVAREEFDLLRPRVLLLRGAGALLPRYSCGRVRAALMRAAGFRVGRGAILCDIPKIYGGRDLANLFTIGAHTFINVGCHFDVFDRIDIGDDVAFGQEVMILTTTHEIGPPEHRAATRVHGPVQIGAGAWIGARATILPSVTVGAGAIVGAGALVNRDVAPNTIVAGVPARVVANAPD